MRQRNRKTKSVRPSDRDKLLARNNWAMRKLVSQHGSHEAISDKLHQSAFKLQRRKKIARVISIPSFEGWLFFESEKYWGVIAPKGRSGKFKACDSPAFRGNEVSRLPGGKESPELLAKKLIALIKEGAKATTGDPTRGVIVRSDKGEWAPSANTIICIRKNPPPLWGSPLSEKTWRIALQFVKIFRLHLGVSDTTPQEKIIPLAGGIPLVNPFRQNFTRP